jgi:hypothetical protein
LRVRARLVRTGGTCGRGTGVDASQVYVSVYGTVVDPLSIHDARSTLWPVARDRARGWGREESRVRHQP